jgi:hypothetical protein
MTSVAEEGKDEVDGAGSSFTEKSHKLGWRDIFDIIVRYRQFSEVIMNLFYGRHCVTISLSFFMFSVD